MSLHNFIPTIWAGALLRNLNNVHIFAAEDVINRDYEGDITGKGDTVKINSIGRVTVSDYTKDTDIAAPEALDDASQVLTIDKAKYFNFAIDDIDKAQQLPKVMSAAMGEAAWGLSDAADLYIAGKYTDIASGNFIGSDGSPKTVNTTAGNLAYDYLVDLGVILDTKNVPKEGRWAILPPWMIGLLLKDERFVSFGTGQNVDNLTNGMVGRAAGFNIKMSNNIPNIAAAKYKVMAGHKIAWSYAEQILETEAYRPERRFADALKGLHVYGAKVTRPDALACLVASP